MEKRHKIPFFMLIIIILIITIIGFLIYEIVVIDYFGLLPEEEEVVAEGLVTNITPYASQDDTKEENVTETDPIVIESNKESSDTVSTETSTNYFYNQLDKYGKIIYQAFEENKDNMKSGTYKIDFGTQFNDLLNTSTGTETLNVAFQSAWNAFTYDNMDLFYINSEKLTLVTKTSTIGSYSTHTVELSCGSNSSYLEDDYSSETEVRTTLSALENIRTAIINEVAGYDDVAKIKYVHDWLIDNVEYDVNLESSDPYSIVGALIEGKAVCEGYARAFKYIMDGLGISCVLVSGTGTNSSGTTESHAWNYVVLDGSWYAVDVTWDDPIVLGNAYVTDEKKYANFLRGSTTFLTNHSSDGYLSPGSMEFKFPTLATEDYPTGY